MGDGQIVQEFIDSNIGTITLIVVLLIVSLLAVLTGIVFVILRHAKARKLTPKGQKINNKFSWRGALVVTGAMAMLGVVVGTINFITSHFETTITKALCGDGVGETIATAEDLEEGAALTTEICENGIVLLKNQDNAFPLTNYKLNIFGYAGCDNGWWYQGNGSGRGSDYGRVTLYNAFRDYGFQINESLANAYTSTTAGFAFKNNQNGQATVEDPYNHYRLTEMDQSFYDTWVPQGKSFSNQALIVIARHGGEGNDQTKYQYSPGNARENSMPSGYEGVDQSRIYSELTPKEEYMINLVCNNYEHVYVLFNCCNVMEMGFIDDNRIDGALFMFMGGNSGPNAVPAVMSGIVTPSGHLPDTAAYDFSTAASYANAGISAPFDSRYDPITFTDQGYRFRIYAEGIYIGYFWYETADAEGFWNTPYAQARWGISRGYRDVVQFPFGYGLSYTDFVWSIDEASYANGATLTGGETLSFTVRVKNIGDFPGKDVIQLYVEKPYTPGGIEKPSVQLVDFAKTGEIEDHSTGDGIVTLTCKLQDIADYDCYDKNNNGFMGYELDAGNYKFSFRSDAHTVKDALVFNYTIAEGVRYENDAVTGHKIENLFTNYTNPTSGATSRVAHDEWLATGQQSRSMDGSDFNGVGINYKYLSRANFQDTFPENPMARFAMGNEINTSAPVYNTFPEHYNSRPTMNADNGLKIKDMFGLDYNDPQWDRLMDQLSYDDMDRLVRSHDIGSFGTSAVSKIEKPRTIDKDGPCGFNSGVSGASFSATNYPSDSMIAATWDWKMAYAFGKSLGNEGVNLLGGIEGCYGPGLNMHRTPLGGRNFEYYSEDPYLAGMLCAKQVYGAKEEGMYCYVKHWVMNDCDFGRGLCYTFASEQTLRQIYAKAFEILVKVGKANALMGSCDKVGTMRVTGCYNLNTALLRDEWGFKGCIITDYYCAGNINDVDECIRSGTDLMLNGANNCTFDEKNSNTHYQCLRKSAKNILYMYADTKNTQLTSQGLNVDDVVQEKKEINAFWKGTVATISWVLIFDCIAGLLIAWTPVIFRMIKKPKLEAVEEVPVAQEEPPKKKATSTRRKK